MDKLGVRAIRINQSPIKQPEAGFAEKWSKRIERVDARCAELGWHVDFLNPGWLTEELLPVFAKMRCSFSIAHMGMFLAKDGPSSAASRKCRRAAERRRAHVGEIHRHLSHGDAAKPGRCVPMARALIAVAPNRLIWGSDYPHLSFADKIGSVQLFNLLADWAPDEATRKRILVDNPAALFGF